MFHKKELVIMEITATSRLFNPEYLSPVCSSRKFYKLFQVSSKCILLLMYVNQNMRGFVNSDSGRALNNSSGE